MSSIDKKIEAFLKTNPKTIYSLNQLHIKFVKKYVKFFSLE